ncbi:MAG: hypothetical protein GX893_03380 [Firmicutes bacterium]|nr:hypothetical protein [Bacillota bacterium]
MTNRICPYCNGLYELKISCPNCGSCLEDCGALQEMLGPYAPYEENSLLMGNDFCIHQLYCHQCQTILQYSVPIN